MANTRKSPGVGRGENLASHDAIRKALAVEILDQERKERENEFRKRHRAGAEKQGVSLGDLDGLYRRRNDQPQDIMADIKKTLHYMGALFAPLKKQYDLFVTASDSVEMQHAAYRAGELAGLTGKAAQPPPALVGEDSQLWLEGHSLGAKARGEAERERAAEEKEEAERVKAEKDAAKKALDGTGKGTDAEKVRAQAAVDFQKDNPGVQAPADLVKTETAEGDGIFDGDGALPEVTSGAAPAGERYMLATDETFPSGRRSTYQDGKPNGSSIPGKLKVYEEHAPVADGFEATEEELAAQATRQEVAAGKKQESELPSEEEIAAGAKKLKESGFVQEKPKRKLPGQKN